MTTFVVPTEAPTVHGPPQGRRTYADWERLPDDENCYEIIDGLLYMTTAPSYFHQWIIQGLREYVIIDSRSRTFNHYRLKAPGIYAEPRIFGESDTASLDCLPSLPIPVAELFAGAPDTTL
jgi:hypothetical protein